jgi:hypothetical protein
MDEYLSIEAKWLKYEKVEMLDDHLMHSSYIKI